MAERNQRRRQDRLLLILHDDSEPLEHPHLMRNRIYLDKDVVEHSDQQIDQQNVGDQQVHGHGNDGHPSSCDEFR